MKIALLGFAGQGNAGYEYWNTPDNTIVIHDLDPAVSLPAGAKSQLGKAYLDNLDQYDVLIRTPSLYPGDIQKANPQAPNILGKVTTVTNEFMRVCPTQNIIGVTGTKGKGTTSTLITRMLEATGKRVHLGGNIGIPPLDLLKNDIKPEDWVVLELANFQLIDLTYSPHIAVCLMVEPEHLNWHSDLDEYLDAKRQLFKNQTKDDIAVYYSVNDFSRSIAAASPGQLIPYMAASGAEVIEDKIVVEGQEICRLADIQLLGKHNWQNVCAATTAVWQISPDPVNLRIAIVGFEGLPHRLEVVREIDGVRYYNDSFASAPGATSAAIEAVAGHKVMIVGGFDRGLPLEELAKVFVSHQQDLRRVLLIGDSAVKLEKELKAHGFNNYDLLHTKDLNEIVSHAKLCAQQGDSVVFSPGFASFDMFKNFEDRGLQYKEIINSLT